ncbi:DUF6427 family protein [Allomuricauda sp. ARW7G5W]|jgi:hypothetical protein|uniref:DUF6427 family protein n=1 Tax=Flagellimonas sp. TaxID=2058762 RepID=UPI000E25C049
MISSFFGKTKPINYIVLSVFLVLFYFLNGFFALDPSPIGKEIPFELLVLLTLLLMVFAIGQVVHMEKITDSNSYTMLFFVLLLGAFPGTFDQENIIFANFFILLAIWRLLSIKSIKNVKHKIFDASLLICIASFFYEWALAFLLIVFVVINIYDRKNFKNWLIPFMGMGTVFILMFALLRISGSMNFLWDHYRFSLETVSLSTLGNIGVKTLIYVLLILLTVFVVFLKMRKTGGGKLVQLRVVFLAFVLGLVIGWFAEGENPVVLFTIFPAAVFMANYMESIRRAKLKEAVLALCIVVPIVLFGFQLNW